MSKVCPLCGYEAKHQGALNMHMYHCKMKNVSRGTNNQEGQKEVKCDHTWRFLNLKAPIEKRAYEGGFIEVCTKCQELKGE
ncbi:MAG: hypothetical protein Q8906_06025 [Bacillota bacterium]|nr:hypothetical protein [Bacillota bacterium]